MIFFHGGTTPHRAPELVAHQRYRNPVDVWALRAVGLQYLETIPNEDDTTEAEYTRRVSDHARQLARKDPSSAHRRLLTRILHIGSQRGPALHPASTPSPSATTTRVLFGIGLGLGIGGGAPAEGVETPGGGG